MRMETRRGGIYIAVLGVTTFVTVIGISGLLLADVQRQTSEVRLDSVAARFEAQSALGVAMSRVAATPNWPTKYPSGVWASSEGLGGAQWSFMLEYDQAAADAGEAVDMTINAIAARERAVRVYAIDAEATSGYSAIQPVANGEFDTGVSGWSATGGSLSFTKAVYHIGPGGGMVSGRPSPLAGPSADVLSGMVQGATFKFEAWVALAGDVSDRWTASIYHDAGGSFQQLELVSGTLAGGFAKLSGAGTISWTGSPPTKASLLIFNWNSTATLYFDSVSLSIESTGDASVRPKAGTFRQRTLE
ncbi:MAG: carbohydrate binding domain-containing protein [Phycisphaerales bacterium]